MPAPFKAALDAIEVFIRGIVPRSEITRVGNERLHVRNDSESIGLAFSRDRLEDFEVVLGGNQPIPYSKGIKSDLYLPVYVALGLKGMISDFRIFGFLLNEEERDWLESCRIEEIRFDPDLAKGLYDGLSELHASLQVTLASDVEVPEVKAELEIVESLTKHYEVHRHLNCLDVGLASLSYLKAAALCWILRLQIEKAGAASARVKLAYDKKIYGIVEQFWVVRPYNRIRLPPAMHDYHAQRNSSAPTTQPVHRSHVDIGSGLEKLDVRLRDRWHGAWAALRSDNPDRVSQATNSMVEVLDQVINRIRGAKEFRDYLSDRFPQQADVVLAARTWISTAKDSLHGVKHNTKEQSPVVAEDLMHQAEWIISLLLR